MAVTSRKWFLILKIVTVFPLSTLAWSAVGSTLRISTRFANCPLRMSTSQCSRVAAIVGCRVAYSRRRLIVMILTMYWIEEVAKKATCQILQGADDSTANLENIPRDAKQTRNIEILHSERMDPDRVRHSIDWLALGGAGFGLCGDIAFLQGMNR